MTGPASQIAPHNQIPNNEGSQSPMTAEMMMRYAVALAIGTLVGLERGWRGREEPAGHRIAGIRTYSITGLLGAVVGSLTAITNSAAPIVASVLIYGLLFGSLEFWKALDEREFSITSFVAALLTLVLGSLAVLGDQRLAAAAGVTLTILLASREYLHSALRKISWIEIRSAIVLAAMTAIVLPMLPDETLDPWGGFNPREVWLLTVLTAAISYFGYIAARLVGPSKGAIVTGLSAGLVSSTSVTLAFARTASQNPVALPLVAGACSAAMVSVLRVCGIVAMIRPDLLYFVAPPALTAALVLAVFAALFLLNSRGAAETREPLSRNPFELKHLLFFAFAFAVVSVVSAAFFNRYGSSSLITSSALSGMFDVDIGVLSALRLEGNSVSSVDIGRAVLGALATNALGRLILAGASGPLRFVLPLSAATACAAASGAVVMLMI